MNTNTTAVEGLRDYAAPLYNKYPGQSEAQDAYVEIDEDGNISASYNAEIGNAVPASVWHNRTLRFAVSPCISGAALADLVASEPVAGLLERIHDGHTVEWNGSNHVGILSVVAQEASDELDQFLREVDPDVVVYTAEEFLFSCAGLNETWDGSDLNEAVASAESNIEPGTFIDGDIREAIIYEARSYVENDRNGLNAGHLTVLVATGEITQDAADEYAAEHAV